MKLLKKLEIAEWDRELLPKPVRKGLTVFVNGSNYHTIGDIFDSWQNRQEFSIDTGSDI